MCRFDYEKNKKTNTTTNAKPSDNLVTVGNRYLVWRFTPWGLPGLSNLFPVLCDS
jgi:hypothetical protein